MFHHHAPEYISDMYVPRQMRKTDDRGRRKTERQRTHQDDMRVSIMDHINSTEKQ